MSIPHDDEYMEYEMGLEGEYDVELPPGYESWAEWHYINGDRLPDESDYYYEDDFSEKINEFLKFDDNDYVYDERTDTYYSPITQESLTQKQLDAKWDAKTAEINALAARLEIYARNNTNRLKRGSSSNTVAVNRPHLSKKEIKQKAKQMGVHPDMFKRNDDWCWKWMRDSNTWLYRHPRLYVTYKYTCFGIMGIMVLVFILSFIMS